MPLTIANKLLYNANAIWLKNTCWLNWSNCCYFPGCSSGNWSFKSPGAFTKVQHPDFWFYRSHEASAFSLILQCTILGRALCQNRLQQSNSSPAFSNVSVPCFIIFSCDAEQNSWLTVPLVNYLNASLDWSLLHRHKLIMHVIFF